MFEQSSGNQPTPNTEPSFTPQDAPTPPPAIVPTPGRKKRNPFIFILLLLIVVALSAVATYAVMTFAIGSSKKTDEAATQTTTTATQTQADKVLAVIAHAKTLLPSTKAFPLSDGTSLPHRKVGAPYNLYASGTDNDTWRVESDAITDTTSAAQLTKSIYQYFVTEQKATIDTLIGDTAFLPIEKSDTKFISYRVNTADYTCGIAETANYANKSPYALSGATIKVSCSTEEEYAKNAKAQQPFYAAMSTDKTYTADVTMLSTPTIKDSTTTGYKTAELSIGGDSELAGGAMGLFYQTPDSVWHFFTGTQQELQCSEYNTSDLKKAYVGEACYDNANNSAVKIN